MSYEPKLIISHKDHDKFKVYKFLTELLTYRPIEFEDSKFIICSPEFTTFNKLVRDELEELEIHYTIDSN